MTNPPILSVLDLDKFRNESIVLFRKLRLEEPIEDYGEAFDEYRTAIEELLEQTVDLSQLRQQADGLLKNKKTLEIVRYLAGPLISADDLNTLLDVKAISTKRIGEDPGFAAKVIDMVVNTLDQRRFPWVRDERDPSEAEKLAAVIASASLLANRKIATLLHYVVTMVRKSRKQPYPICSSQSIGIVLCRRDSTILKTHQSLESSARKRRFMAKKPI